MNREEAINFANCLKNNYTVDLNDMEAFCDMAIKALAQEPTTKNDLGVEYISRSELMAILSDYYDTTVEYRSMLKEIAALPPVTPQEPKKGYWTYIRNSEVNGLKIVECSECGKRTYGSGNYCPNCGADMREVEE